MLLNISDSTDQIRKESQSGSYGSQVVTSHQIKVTWDRLWTSHRAILVTLEVTFEILHYYWTCDRDSTVTVCSLINDKPLPVSPFFVARAWVFYSCWLKHIKRQSRATISQKRDLRLLIKEIVWYVLWLGEDMYTWQSWETTNYLSWWNCWKAVVAKDEIHLKNTIPNKEGAMVVMV